MNRQQMRETMKARRGDEHPGLTQLRLFQRSVDLNKKEETRLFAHRIAWEQHAETMEVATMRLAIAAEEANQPFWRRWFK